MGDCSPPPPGRAVTALHPQIFFEIFCATRLYLQEYYYALMISDEEVMVGQCLITRIVRHHFNKTISLLSNTIISN